MGSGEWRRVAEAVEASWPELVASAISALDDALRMLPAELGDDYLTAAAVRDLRLNIPGDTRALDALAARAARQLNPTRLQELGRSPRVRRAMSAASAFMLAYRLHGRFRKSLHFASITEELARHARVTGSQEIALRIPSALLQVGITKMLAGEDHGASINLREAWEMRHETWDGRVGGDAAGKLALLYAVRGETLKAEKWLSRHDDGEGAVGWMVPLVQLAAKIAAALIAIDRLDQRAAEAALDELELLVNRERSWAPYITYAHARYGLYWGDRRAAIESIVKTRAFAGASRSEAAIEPRLQAVEANLLLATDRPDETRALISQNEANPHVTAVAARLAAITGRSSEARQLSARGLSHEDLDPRTQIDLLVTSALSAESPHDSRRHLQQAVATASRTKGIAPFALAHRALLTQVMADMPSTRDRRWVEESLEPVPEPMPQTIHMIDLTAIERRVLALLVDGYSRSQIAVTLFVSENTVKFHVRNVYRKLGVSSRTEAVAKAYRLKLLPGGAKTGFDPSSLSS